MMLVTLVATTAAVLIVFGAGMINELRKANRVIGKQNELIKNQWIALSVLRESQQSHTGREHK